jgi:hypothetical protein
MMQTIATQCETINKHLTGLNPQQHVEATISPPRKRRPPNTDKIPTKSNKQLTPTTNDPINHDTKMSSQNSDDEDDSDSDEEVTSTHTDARASVGRED